MPNEYIDGSERQFIDCPSCKMQRWIDADCHHCGNSAISCLKYLLSALQQKYNRLFKLTDNLRCAACCKKIVFFAPDSVVGNDCYQALQQENERLVNQVVSLKISVNNGIQSYQNQRIVLRELAEAFKMAAFTVWIHHEDCERAQAAVVRAEEMLK